MFGRGLEPYGQSQAHPLFNVQRSDMSTFKSFRLLVGVDDMTFHILKAPARYLKHRTSFGDLFHSQTMRMYTRDFDTFAHDLFPLCGNISLQIGSLETSVHCKWKFVESHD